jgi:hypothetical protein
MDRVTQLLNSAREQTGLRNFGEHGFREGLEVLVEALDREARLNATGRAVLDGQIVDLLCNRLKIEDWYDRHPEIDDQDVVAPLIGVGLPRTGSSALGCLLGEDPHARSLRTWESTSPCPPPDPATMADDPRIARQEAAMERRARMFPRMVGMLPSTATSPTECQLFMGYDFKSQIFQPFAEIPSYVDWLVNRADLVPTYRYVKRVLKLLQWRWPTTRWRIKNPSHILFIDALDQVFPDARFVMTHRDAAAVIPSVADLYLEIRKALSDTPDLMAIGREGADWCELGMRRMIAFRDAGQDHRFFDIQFEPFQADPFPILEKLYDFLGEDLTPEARAGMAAWRRSKPRSEQQYERTDPATFGLDRAELRERFRFYSDRIGVLAAAA